MSKNWIQHAVNPAHKGFCSPISKKTCTGRRKAFAMTMKKHHGFHADGGELDYIENPNMSFNYDYGGFLKLVPNRELNYADGGEMQTANTIRNALGNIGKYFFNIDDKNLLESKYRPTKGDGNEKYYTRSGMKYDVYNDLVSPKVMKDYNHNSDFEDIHKALLNNGNDRPNNASKSFPKNKAGYKGMYNKGHGSFVGEFNLGRYTVDAGEDKEGKYISFVDKYDWNGMPNKKRTINYYDRIYEKDWNNIKHGVDAISYANGGQIDPYLQYYDAQSLYTKALQDKYPDVPIMDILSNSAKDKSFKHDKLESMADSLRSKYGDISLNRDDIANLVSAGYPDIIGLNRTIQDLDNASSNRSINTTGKNEPNSESFGWRMLMQRSYPKGSSPYKYLDNEMASGGTIHIKPSKVGSLHKHLGVPRGEKIPASKLSIKATDSPSIRKKKQFAINARKWSHENGGYINNATNEDYSNLMFLGGKTHDETNANMIGGAAQLGIGFATGNPATIATGGASFLANNIKNAGTVLKDKDSTLLEKGLSIVSPLAGGIFANSIRDKESSWNETNDAIKERNKMFNVKAKGGVILPLGVQPNMAMNYDDGGKLLTEFNNGGRHETNIYGGVPQGSDRQGNPNLVEEGETKFDNYIFSDRLKLDESAVSEHNLPKSMTGKTFAEASKRINKLYKERPNDAITKSTAKDYLTRLTSANDKARSIDEENTMMAYGGNLYENGDYLNLEDTRILDRYLNPMPSMSQIKSRYPSFGDQKYESDALNEKVAKISAMNLNSKTKLGSSNNLDGVGSFFKDPKNLRYAPIAFDVLTSTGLLGKTPTPKTTSPTLIQNQGMLSPQAIDEMQASKLVDEAYQTGVSGLSEASGGSGSALRSGLMGLTSDYASSLGKTFADVNRSNIAQKQAADQFNLQTQGNVASQNAQLVNQSNLYNNQLLNAKAQADYENRMSYLGKAAEGVGDVGYESRLGEILPKIYGYDQYGNYTAKLKKGGGRLRLKSYKK